MEFKVGDKFKLRGKFWVYERYKDCSVATVYEVMEACDKFTWLKFKDDIGDTLNMGRIAILKYITLAVEPKHVKNFMGYETARDFEQIIDYALASNDLALFNECTAELDKRGLLEDYVSLV